LAPLIGPARGPSGGKDPLLTGAPGISASAKTCSDKCLPAFGAHQRRRGRARSAPAVVVKSGSSSVLQCFDPRFGASRSRQKIRAALQLKFVIAATIYYWSYFGEGAALVGMLFGNREVLPNSGM
jgi:hypothetical protein